MEVKIGFRQQKKSAGSMQSIARKASQNSFLTAKDFQVDVTEPGVVLHLYKCTCPIVKRVTVEMRKATPNGS